ncbi:MAG TPA: hypothetical protein VNO30_21895 [Kofleriaceae bacterium]|nr:hypothetical protein [Kofleriaceae bacterium]
MAAMTGRRPSGPGHGALAGAHDFAPATVPRRTSEATAQAEPQAAVVPASAPAAVAQTAGLLSARDVADAIHFHTAQPWKYTKAVIIDIQSAVAVAPTGVMDAATVQAIAARQAAVNAERKPTPLLKVDGKAGPRTLPILKPVGLATDEAIDEYVADIGELGDTLNEAKFATRAELLRMELNKRLAAAGVPAITKPVEIDRFLSDFTPAKWTLRLSAAALADPKRAAAMAYHEARHAEEYFRIARMLAGKKHSAAQIACEVPIEAPIAAQAMQQPLAPGTTEAVEAEGWHEDELGRPSQGQQKATRTAVIREFFAAARAYKKAQTPANRARVVAAYERYKDVYYVHGYRDLPDEYDAFFVGEKVGDKLGVPRDDFPPLDEMIAQVPEQDPAPRKDPEENPKEAEEKC